MNNNNLIFASKNEDVDGYIIYDIESTGLSSEDDIIQVAWIKCDKNFILEDHGQVYMNTDKILSEKVRDLTGLNHMKLQSLSDNKFFEDVMDNLVHVFRDQRRILVGHNISFDLRLTDANLSRHGRLSTEYYGQLCTMQEYRPLIGAVDARGRIKNPNLGATYAWAIKNVKGNREKFDNAYEQVFKRKLKAHDAMYDVYMTYIALRLLGRSLIKNAKGTRERNKE